MSVNVTSVLNALQPICMIGGCVVTLLSLGKPSKRETYVAKLLSINSGIALMAVGILCSLIASDGLGGRVFYGILVALMLVALALPERLRKENSVEPDGALLANTHVSQNNP